MNTMRSRFRQAAGALALGALCTLGAGCGFFSREKPAEPVPSGDFGEQSFFAIPAIARVGAVYDIYRVTPDQGPLAGGDRARLDGTFPNPIGAAELTAVTQIYTVYFGYNIAPYDFGAPPTMSSALIYVTVPAGDAPGLVDVIFRETATQLDAATLYYGYEYLDPFDITGVVPELGPIAGGQQVTVFGRFPIAAPITTVAAADAAYRVYIDSRPAAFDSSFNPVITSGAMYVITPPGLPPNAPGLVDVSVATMVYSPDTPEFRVLPLGYEYIGDLDLTSVTPDRGFIFGDEPVTLGGTFPVSTPFSNALIASQASLYYTAYFGLRIAPFDQTVPTPVITPTQMLLRSPPADAVGFVDVRVQEATDPRIADTLARAFRYYALYITDVIPDNGPVAGGTQVKIEGLIPAIFSIYNIYEAAQYYTVRFDGNVAAFDSTRNPIILPSQIDTINRTYTTGHMYVIAPPGAAPGFVDVSIEDNLDIDLPAVCPDCYEYTGGDDISRWDTVVVAPNPVGKLEAGELLVTITGVGKMTNADANPVFIVPQGGEPDQTGDRIELETTSYNESGSGFTWEGTNKNAIPRVLNGLLVDGHAAIYIEEDSGDILGDNTNDPSDGGVIQPGASEGRHFLIDTVPPRLQLNPFTGHLRGDDFVDCVVGDCVVGNWTLDDVDSSSYPQDFPHPYSVSGLSGAANGVYDAPFDGHWMYRAANANSLAQVFFNVSSLTNNFADSAPDASGVPTANLQFTLDVIFEDVDIYTAMDMDQTEIDAGRNADFFGGSRVRQVAGFTGGTILPPQGSDRDSALTSGNRVLIQWDFQSTPFRLPEFEGVSVTYTATGPSSIGSNQGLSTNLAATPTVLRGTFDIGNASNATTGVQLDEAGVRTMMSVVFRAVDRAGDYTPQSNATPGTKKLYTRNDTRSATSGGYAVDRQPEIGPLNLWWLRTTATRLISNIPASGDTRAPSFTWENTGEPDPGAYPDSLDGDGSERLYSYGIYRTNPASGTRDEQRDGPWPYTLVGSLIDNNSLGGAGFWSGWNAPTTLTANQVQDILLQGDGGGVIVTEGAWFLLVVMSCDEAGNIELWPETQLVNPSGAGPSIIDSVNDAAGAEERNWERWFVPPSGEAVDTRIEPLYWHDSGGPPFNGIVDTGEASFGDAEVIPYPPRATFSPPLLIERRVAAQIRVRLLTDAGNANADWELLENGVSVATGTGAIVLGDGFTVVLRDPYLGVASRQPTYYVFRARTFIDNPLNPNGTLDSGEIYDTSPATVQFVVVDNVANFIQNRKSEDTQPIQEIDRP